MSDEKQPSEAKATTKKPYVKPFFRYERVFGTMALQCGRVLMIEQRRSGELRPVGSKRSVGIA